MKKAIYNKGKLEYVEMTEEELKEIEERNKQEAPEREIKELKQKLLDTDYKAIKYAEGHISEEEYAPIKAERQEWRNRINELEESI